MARTGQPGRRHSLRLGTRTSKTQRCNFSNTESLCTQALRQEVVFASYLSLTTIVLPPPRLENREFVTDYARAVNGALASSWHIHVSRPFEARLPPMLILPRRYLFACQSPITPPRNSQIDRQRLRQDRPVLSKTTAKHGRHGTPSGKFADTHLA